MGNQEQVTADKSVSWDQAREHVFANATRDQLIWSLRQWLEANGPGGWIDELRVKVRDHEQTIVRQANELRKRA